MYVKNLQISCAVLLLSALPARVLAQECGQYGSDDECGCTQRCNQGDWYCDALGAGQNRNGGRCDQQFSNPGGTCVGDTCCYTCIDPNQGGICTPRAGCKPNSCQNAPTTCDNGTYCDYTPKANGTSCDVQKICNNSACVSGCWIGNQFVVAGTVNSTNPCQQCDPAISTSTWTSINEAQQATCGTGKVCHLGACTDGCGISGSFVAPNALNGTNPCQACLPGTSVTTWTNQNELLPATCAAGKVCRLGACTDGCGIGGVFRTPGEANGPCQACVPTTSVSAWTPVNQAAASTCPAKQFCDGGTCKSGCVIGGAFVAAGSNNGGNPCQTCDPNLSTSAWTIAAEGAACNGSSYCHAGSCQQGCFIAGSFYAANALSANGCQKCDVAAPTTWTNLALGTACGTASAGTICDAGQCKLGCAIASAFVPSGATETNHLCHVCAPLSSTSAWSNQPPTTPCESDSNPCTSDVCNSTGGCTNLTVSPGSSCGAGQVCNGSVCSSGCWIDGNYWASNTPNPANGCQACKPGTSTTAWSDANEGGACGGTGSGKVCHAGLCADGCFISSTFYAPNTPQPSVACKACLPAVSTTAWSSLPGGTACGTTSSEFCDAGTCKSGCWIAGAYYALDAANGANTCQRCKPATSPTTWTNQSNGTACAGGVCDQGACQAECFIGGTLYGSGVRDPANSCQQCVPASSTTTWALVGPGVDCTDDGRACTSDKCDGAGTCQHANLPNGTSCGGGQTCTNGGCGTGCTIGGTNYAPDAPNPANPCQACRPELSLTDWSPANEALPTNCSAGRVCHAGACTLGCGIYGVYFASGAVSATNPCQVCAPTTSATGWSPAANGLSCGAGSGQVCQAGACADGCWIGGQFLAPNAANASNPCQACKPLLDSQAFSPVNEALPSSCTAGKVCHLGNCTPGCGIAGAYWAAGASDPADPCQSCVPVTSRIAWTFVEAAACGSGQYCHELLCQPGCLIDGTFRQADEANPASTCQICKPAAPTVWSAAADGKACPTGVCAAGACADQCFVAGALYANGAPSPTSACLVCATAASRSAFSPASSSTACASDGNDCTIDVCDGVGGCAHQAGAEGVACGSGGTCHTGECADGCFIGGAFVPKGGFDPVTACQACVPATSRTGWTQLATGDACADDGNPCTRDTCDAARACVHANLDDRSSCGGGKYCFAGACATACVIDSVPRAEGEADPTESCRKCAVATSTTTWTRAASGSLCADDGNLCTHDLCDSAGTCAHPNAPNTTYCGPSGERCVDGACPCVAVEATCTDGLDNDCNGATDCSDPDCSGLPCDLDKCRPGATCSSGACAGGTPVVCGAPPACRAAGACNPATGACDFPLATAGTACSSACGAGTCDNQGNCQSPCDAGTASGPDSGTVAPGADAATTVGDGGTDAETPPSDSYFGCSCGSVGGGAPLLLIAAALLLALRRSRARGAVALALVAGLGLAVPRASAAEQTASAAPSAKAAKRKIAVLTLKAGPGVDAKTAELLTDMLTDSISKLPATQVVSTKDLEATLGFEKQKALLGCSETSCLAEIGGALGVDKLVNGTLGKLGKSIVLTVQLIDAKKSVAERRHSSRSKGADDEGFLDLVSPAVAGLFGDAPTSSDPVAAGPEVTQTAERAPLLGVKLRGQFEAADRLGFAGAVLVGAQPLDQLRVSAGALLSSSLGAVVNVSWIPVNATGRLYPLVGLEVPLLFSPRFTAGVGANVGVEWAPVSWLTLGLEVPLYYFFDAEAGKKSFYVFGAATAGVRFL